MLTKVINIKFSVVVSKSLCTPNSKNHWHANTDKIFKIYFVILCSVLIEMQTLNK